MKQWKKSLFTMVTMIVAIISMLFLLTSCFPSYNLTTTAMIQAIGIDMTEDGKFDITLQIFEPQGSAGIITIDPAVNNASVITVSGETIFEAINKVSGIQSEYPYLGQNRMIVLGERLSSHDISEVFSFFEHNQLTRPNVDILMAKGSAREIIEINMKHGMIAASTIERTLENSLSRGNLIRAPYLPFLKKMHENNGAGALPVIEKNKQEEEKPKEGEKEQDDPNPEEKIMSVDQIRIKEVAIFSYGRLVDILNEPQSRGLALLKNKVDQRLVLVQDEQDRYASLNLYRCRTTLKPEICGAQINFVLKIEASATIEESYFQKQDATSKEIRSMMSELCSQALQKECEETFDIVIRQKQCDVLGLQLLLQKNYPKTWKKISDSYPWVMEDFGFRVESNVQINRIGAETI